MLKLPTGPSALAVAVGLDTGASGADQHELRHLQLHDQRRVVPGEPDSVPPIYTDTGGFTPAKFN